MLTGSTQIISVSSFPWTPTDFFNSQGRDSKRDSKKRAFDRAGVKLGNYV